MTAKSDFLHAMHERGFFNDCTNEAGLDGLLVEGHPVPCYIGFDCTASSLHIGSLVQIMMLRWWQTTGHKPYVLMGGGTSKVGDPSGRDTSRQLIDAEGIETNKRGIQQVFTKYLTFGDGPDDAVMVDNAEWLDELNYIEFLREYGRHFSINRMLSMDSVRLRLDRDQPLSFLEFNYMLLQAYDFAELNKRYGVRMQMGGSDQWGNIVNGIDLGRRVGTPELFGLTSPLLTTADGKKMGKSADGAVWLNGDMLDPYSYWQYWRNVDDADVGRFLRLFTELPLQEVARLEALEGAEINEAKKLLASEVTTLCHGSAAALTAAKTAQATFEQGALGADLPVLEIPSVTLRDGITLPQILQQSGLASSGKEAKRLIAEGGARLNDRPVTDAGYQLELSAFDAGDVKLSAGKKKHVVLRRR